MSAVVAPDLGFEQPTCFAERAAWPLVQTRACADARPFLIADLAGACCSAWRWCRPRLESGNGWPSTCPPWWTRGR